MDEKESDHFEFILPVLQLEMSPDGRVLLCEGNDLLPVEIINQS